MLDSTDQARAVIDAARHAYRSTLADRERVRAALASRIAQTPPAEARPAANRVLAGKALSLVLMVGGFGSTLRDAAPREVAAPIVALEGVAVDRGVIEEDSVDRRSTPSPLHDEAASPPLPPGPPPQALVPGQAHPLARVAPRPAAQRPEDADSLATELRLLHDARRALHEDDARGSLTKLDQLAESHPQGVLRQERMVAQVLSLCAVGDTEGAREIARHFLVEAPTSPLRDRVITSCALQNRSGLPTDR
jgi:hypothetical protein